MIRPLSSLCVCGILLGLSLPLCAQSSIRPGSTGGVRSTGTSGTSRGSSFGGGGGNSSNSANGSHTYRSNTQLGDAIVQIDPETRSLIIVTDEDTHLELEKVIKDLDKPKPQVLIKVVFLEVTYNKDFDLGVEGSYTFKVKNPVAASTGTQTTNTTSTSGTTTTTSNTTTALSTAASGTGSLSSLFGLSSLTTGSFVRVASDDWSATLRALANHGKVEVLSRPSIMARNNQEALIVVGQEVPFITNSRTDALGNLTNTIQYDNVGIILRVTPFITSNNSVEMIVAPEISALTSQTVPISSNASAPVISKRSAETVVVTPNGTTAVIGGLMQTQRTANIQKIPLLGDIPLIGTAFRRKTTNDVKTELLIFLTPTVVNSTELIQANTTEATANTELVKQAFTEKEFQKFFDELPTKMPDAPPGSAKVVEKRATVKTVVSSRQPSSTPIPKTSPKKVPASRDPAAPDHNSGI